MTGANVSGLSAAASADTGIMTPSSQKQGETDGASFMKLMKSSLVSGASSSRSGKDSFISLHASSVQDLSSKVTQNAASKSAAADSSSEPSVSVDFRVRIQSDQAAGTTAPLNDAVNDKLDQLTEDLKDTLTEELGISDDQLTEAMEQMGFTFADLLNPSNLTQLISSVTGTEDQVSLLVSDTTGSLLGRISDLLQSYADDLSLPKDQLAALYGEKMQTDLQTVSLFEDETKVVSDNSLLTADAAASTEDATVSAVQQDPAEQTAEQTSESESSFAIVIDDQRTDASQQTAAAATAAPQSTKETEDSSAAPETQNPAENITEEPETVSRVNTSSSETSSFSEDSDFGADDFSPFAKTEVGTETTVAAAGNGQDAARTVSFEQTISRQETVSYQSISVTDVMNQIVTEARATLTDRISTMEMQLNPQNLGRMIMKVTEQEGTVTTHLILQNESVKDALTQQMAVMKTNLEAAGIRVDAVEVTVGTHEFEEALEGGMTEPDQQMQGSGDDGNHRNDRNGIGNINLSSQEMMDGTARLTEEEQLVASIMRDQGSTLNYKA